MAKIDIDFTIRNEDKEQTFKTKGILKDNTMLFHDDKGQKHDLLIEGKQLRYRRSGDPAFEFVFEKGVSHNGTYRIGHQTIPMNVQTHQLKAGDGVVTATYTLKQDDAIIGHSAFTIKYNETKEEHP